MMIEDVDLLKWWWQRWPWQWFWQQETERRPWDAANLWVPSNPDHYERLGTCHKTPATHTIMAKLSNVDGAACTEAMTTWNMFERGKNCSVFLDYQSADDLHGDDDDRVIGDDYFIYDYSSDGWSPLCWWRLLGWWSPLLRWWSLITLVMKIM